MVIVLSELPTTFPNHLPTTVRRRRHHKVLAPYWVDQTVFEPNGVFTTTTGSAPNRVFYIEWRSVYFGSPDALNYEIALFENATPAFEYIYNTINPASTGNDSQ